MPRDNQPIREKATLHVDLSQVGLDFIHALGVDDAAKFDTFADLVPLVLFPIILALILVDNVEGRYNARLR